METPSLYTPLEFWFNNNSSNPLNLSISVPSSIISNNQPRLFDINKICDCVLSIKSYFNEWKNENINIPTELKPIFDSFKNNTQICILNFNEIPIDTQNIIINILCFLQIKQCNVNNISVEQFIEKYYNYNYDQTMIILSFIEQLGFIDHGVSLRCCFLSPNGEKIIGAYPAYLDKIKSFVVAN